MLSSSGISSGAIVRASQVVQFFNVLTGIMTDQVITLGDGLVLAANAGAGTLTFGEASGKIIPGATQLSFRNHANGADNFIILDSGVLQLRSIPGAAPTTAGQLAYDSTANALVYGNGSTTISLPTGITGTAYAVLCVGAAGSGTQNVVGVGTSGQVLTSNGAAALPTWQTTARYLGKGTATVDQSITSTSTPGTDVTGLTVTCTPDGSHDVKITVSIPDPKVAAGSISLALQKDGVVIANAFATDASGNATNSAITWVYVDSAPTNASHTYKISAWKSGANTLHMIQGDVANVQNLIMVEQLL